MISSIRMSCILLVLSSMKTVTSSPIPNGDNLVNGMEIIGSMQSTDEPDICTGTIKLTTHTEVHSVSSSQGEVRKKKFGTVEYITVEGNCCWRVATRTNYRGTTTDFMEAVTESNHGKKVKSVKQIEC